jgi:dihydropteroate synthase
MGMMDKMIDIIVNRKDNLVIIRRQMSFRSKKKDVISGKKRKSSLKIGGTLDRKQKVRDIKVNNYQSEIVHRPQTTENIALS